VYGKHNAIQTNHHSVSYGGRLFTTVSLYDAGCSITNYGTINSARTLTDCRIRVRKPLVHIRPQTMYLDVVFLSPARLVLSIMQETLPCTFLSVILLFILPCDITFSASNSTV
jgi:hypothetical protein